MGTAIKELAAKLPNPIAEFVSPDQKHFPISEGETTFGRTKGTHVFADTAMSRSHAKVYLRGEDFFIEDTGSTNGTFVKAREKTPIPEGAVMAVAGQLLKVFREVGGQKAPPARSA
jgi:pSer/pThr/pTyr-binding forkhead associated (FHA) protein